MLRGRPTVGVLQRWGGHGGPPLQNVQVARRNPVEEMIVTEGGQPRRVDVPIEVHEGVNQAGRDVDASSGLTTQFFVGGRLPAKTPSGTGTGKGIGYGVGGAGGGGRGVAPPSPRALPAADTGLFNLIDDAQRRDEVGQKLHTSVWHLVERLRKQQNIPTADEVQFVRDGKAEVQVWLTEKSDEALAQLKALGFEVMLEPKSSKLIIGRIPIEKLEALAKLKFVRYISPQVLK